MSNTILNPGERLQSIADAIAHEYAMVRGAIGDADDARALAKEANAGTVNARELVMGKLATLAIDGAWTAIEVAQAAKMAVAANNDVKAQKACQTYMGEACLAMNPTVRGLFAPIVEVRNTAWDAESALDKDAPHPLKKAFVRKYHALVQMLREASKGLVIETPEDLVLYARAHDPDLDPKKVAAKVADVREKLEALYALVSVTALADAIVLIKRVDEGAVKAFFTPVAAKNTHTKSATVVDITTTRPRPASPVKPVHSVSIPNVVQTSPEIQEGAFDALLDATLEG